MKKINLFTIIGSTALFFQGCTHSFPYVGAQNPAPVERSLASLNSLSSTGKFNAFSQAFAQSEADTLKVINQEGEGVDEEGIEDLAIPLSDYDKKALAAAEKNQLIQPQQQQPQDIAGVSSIPELQSSAISRVQGGGNWAFEFIYISPKGEETVLSQYNIHNSMIPASTNKIFSGYFSFVNQTYADKVMAAMLHVSNNNMAEAALRSVSKKGISPLSGMKSFYSKLDDAAKYSPVDGSGLSRSNRVTARLEVSLLKKIYKSGNYDKFSPLMGHPTGKDCNYDTQAAQKETSGGAKGEYHAYHSTIGNHVSTSLAERFHGKTGTLPSIKVKALAGFVDVPTSQGNGVIIFSGIANYAAGGTGVAYAKLASLVKVHTDYVDQYLAK